MARAGKQIGVRELRVGIFMFAALTVLILLLLNATGNFNPFEQKINLRARFPSADGLREGAEVQLAGLTIGKVIGVKLLPPDSPENEKVEAQFSVSANIDGQPMTDRVRTDSTAKLYSTTLLGNDKIILISAGSASGAPVTEDYVLRSITQSSINQVTESGDKLVQQLNKLAVPVTDIAQKINDGEGTAGKLINDPELYNSLNGALRESEATINEIETVISRLGRGEGTAGKLLNDERLYNNLNRTTTQLEAIANDLRAGRGTAGKFLRDEEIYNELRATIVDARNSVARLNRIADQFEPIIADLSAGRGTAGKFLKDEELYNEARNTLARFGSTSERIENIVSAAERGEGTVGKLLRDDSLYNNINQVSSETTKLLYDFRQNPKKYLTIKFELF
jgi:phospholipid/cholesterol/gamma-HCH transport system substrate-binding protein